MTTTTAPTASDLFATAGAFAAEAEEMEAEFLAVAAGPVVVPAAPVVRCLGCGRALRSARALSRGYGEKCWRKAHRRAATLGPEYSDAQVESAIEAIEDGAVVPAAVAGVWFVVGSRGDAVYETTLATCTCQHFTERGKACHHRAAVALVA